MNLRDRPNEEQAHADEVKVGVFSRRVPVISSLDDPLPSTGHPLGVLAQAWVLFNCLLLGSFACGTLAWLGLRFVWRWATGNDAPFEAEVYAVTAGVSVGFVVGIALFRVISRRLGRRGVDLVLMSLTLIPVVGPGLAIVFFLVRAVEWLVKRQSKGAEEG